VLDAKRKIYGSIMTSESIGAGLRGWREFFKVTQSQLAEEMRVSPSVISDYEGGRQKYPGSKFLKKYVESLIRIDEGRGAKIIRLLSSRGAEQGGDAILDIREYEAPIRAREIARATNSKILVNEDMLDVHLYGHTVLDSVPAILSLSGEAFYSIYGASSERALIFMGVTKGRSPMVAIRVSPLKPRMVILHGPSTVDELAQKIAEKERIILALSGKISEKELTEGLRAFKRA
ncbi:MAG: helix-turn-helix domain-containing protein, partial [Candidatus Geothermarchaeales archaeon]